MRFWLDAARHALPWVAAPLWLWWRSRDRTTLDDYAEDDSPDARGAPAPRPHVTVVVPARDEARNVGRCVASVLATTYPALDLVVVDDHSTDGTADRARAAAAGDPRLRIVVPPALPSGWMGKQWACATGAKLSSGDLLLFADADTAHAPDLVGHMVAAVRARAADLLSVAGTQEMGTLWEKLVQPQLFAVIAGRYGGTDRVSRARRPVDTIANGQCLLISRAAYERVGTHAAVRGVVVEDLALAKRAHALGLSVQMVRGERQLSTRMYTSLRELVAGWRKNVYAGGREAMPFGTIGRLVFPLLLVSPALAQLWPPLRLLALAPGRDRPAEWVGMWIALGATVGFWAAVYRRVRLSPLWALAFPAGALLYLVIALQAIARGRRVEWRGRTYRSDPVGPAPERAHA